MLLAEVSAVSAYCSWPRQTRPGSPLPGYSAGCGCSTLRWRTSALCTRDNLEHKQMLNLHTATGDPLDSQTQCFKYSLLVGERGPDVRLQGCSGEKDGETSDGGISVSVRILFCQMGCTDVFSLSLLLSLSCSYSFHFGDC